MIGEIIKQLKEGKSLNQKEAENIFSLMIHGKMHPQDVEAFLCALRDKGEVLDEVVGAVRVLKAKATSIHLRNPDAIDVCGTGGDQKGTFNISSAVAFVVAGAGVCVAKHGNRAVSSQSGSADILKALGVKLDLSSDAAARCIDEVGIGFLFAPQFHPVLRELAPIRKKIGTKTIFNLLGPLLNPASVKKQVVGVYSKNLLPLMVSVLKNLGSQSVGAVWGHDGLDELTLTGPSSLCFLHKGNIFEEIFDPKTVGYSYCKLSDLGGGTPDENAKRLKQVLKGHSMPLDHCVHLNAALALRVAGKASDMKEGLLLAQASISSGKAYQKLEELVEWTNKH